MNRFRGLDAPLFLVGFMGVGKTTAGRALAGRLGWEFEDTDELVERALGRTVESIFRDAGEGRFREAEWDALRSLHGRRRVVVATGGGLFLGVPQRAFIRANGLSCWLDAPLASNSRGRDRSGRARTRWPGGSCSSAAGRPMRSRTVAWTRREEEPKSSRAASRLAGARFDVDLFNKKFILLAVSSHSWRTIR